MKELNLKNMKIREMFERIMKLEDEVAEFQRRDMVEEEEEEVEVVVVEEEVEEKGAEAEVAASKK